MPILYVYDERAQTFRVSAPEPEAQMPLVTHLRFSAADFAGSTRSALLWTTRRTLEALDSLAMLYPAPLAVDHAFRRAGPRGAMRPHHCGTAFDAGSTLDAPGRDALRRAAIASGLFYRVSPGYDSGVRVRLFAEPPRALLPGMAGADVFALQDALLFLGLGPCALTGVFDGATRRAVQALERQCGLPETGCFRMPEASALAALTTGAQDAKIEKSKSVAHTVFSYGGIEYGL